MERTCLWNLLHGIQENMAKLAAGTDLFWMVKTKLGASEKKMSLPIKLLLLNCKIVFVLAGEPSIYRYAVCF